MLFKNLSGRSQIGLQICYQRRNINQIPAVNIPIHAAMYLERTCL